MKKILFFTITLCSNMLVFSQNADSVKITKELQGHPQIDSFHINRLVALARLQIVPGAKKDSLFNLALALSRKISYEKGESMALRGVATSILNKGDRNQAFKLLGDALVIAKRIGDKQEQRNIYYRMATTKMGTNENKAALEFLLKSEQLANELPEKDQLSAVQRDISGFYMNSLSDLPRAMEWALKAISTAEKYKCDECLPVSWNSLASLYTIANDQESSLYYYQKAMEGFRKLGRPEAEKRLLNNVGERYRMQGKYKEALAAYKEGIPYARDEYNVALMESNIADVYMKIGELDSAFYYGFKALEAEIRLDDTEGIAWVESGLSKSFLKAGKPDSAIAHARNGLAIASETGTLEFMRDNYEALASAYAAKKDFEKAYLNRNLHILYRDSMLNSQVSNRNNLMQYNYNLQKKENEIAQLSQQKQSQRYILIGAAIALALIIIATILLTRSNRQKQKAFELLSKQKTMIEDQRDQTNKALADLQLTQSQLLQSEKMASLGELTAGIAHEIQNPLNFVNNFSEVSNELIDEMNEELEKGDLAEAKIISAGIKMNLEKINHHGKRADAIVKGMLQHSRANSGVKEPTDINALCDEYLRLAYHGLRAKDKSFNSGFTTDFDNSIGKISVMPQDIGRVVLNIITNAFYAVDEKKKQQPAGYDPMLSVSTKAGTDKISIIINDNGNGIPANVLDKIFQPFFTTKPTGKGTGLGLSMAYDIIKAHGGELKVETKEGEGTAFNIQLPR